MFEEDEKQREILSQAKLKYGKYFAYFKQAGYELSWIEENHEKFTEKKNICIVGNGHSLLGRKSGSIIDSFDCVCRFSDCVIPNENNQEILGSKTTHVTYDADPLAQDWSKGRLFEDVENKIILLQSDQYKSMLAWLYYFSQKNGSLYDSARLIKMLIIERLGIEDINDQKIWKSLSSYDLYDTKQDWTLVPNYISIEIADKTVAYPSLGMSTIFYFKEVLNYNVSVIGCDFEDKHICTSLTEDKKAPLHERIYYDEEALVFDYWVEKGEIELL